MESSWNAARGMVRGMARGIAREIARGIDPGIGRGICRGIARGILELLVEFGNCSWNLRVFLKNSSKTILMSEYQSKKVFLLYFCKYLIDIY